MTFYYLVILILVAWGTWWLTGIDKTAGGESKQGHYVTRTLRCVAVVFLFALMLGLARSGVGYGGIPMLLIFPISIALLLRSSVSELLTQSFIRLFDPGLNDQREFDPKKSRRYQDTIAHLIHSGRQADAIKLCEELKQSGEVEMVILENTLEYLGVKQNRAPIVKPLSEAARLRTQGKFAEAEQLLKSLLKKNPADDGAALMLMRLYAQDLRRPDQAHEVLNALAKQPHVPASHLDFARRSISEWATSPGSSGCAATTPARKPCTAA